MHIFTYGTLMFPSIWQAVVNGEYHHQQATLRGYQRVYIQGDSYPVLRPAPLAEGFEGRVYFDVSHSDLKRLDAFEGNYYQRKPIQISSIAGDDSKIFLKAQAYLLAPSYRHLASSRPWTSEQFSQKHKSLFEKHCVPRTPR